jgi:hypothetical protein
MARRGPRTRPPCFLAALAGLLIVGIATPVARAEPLVTGFTQGAVRLHGYDSDEITTFRAEPAKPTSPPRTASARKPSRTSARGTSQRDSFLRQQALQMMVLFGGYYSPMPPAPAPEPEPQSPSFPPPPPTNSSTTSGGSSGTPPPQVVPEPATLVTGLLGLGLAGAAAWRRRRQ